jgi:hypothetical protein
MGIKTIPLSRLEQDPRAAQNECADSGAGLVVQLPDQRRIAIQSLDAGDDDTLVEDLIRANPEFRALVEGSKRGPRKAFVAQARG